MYFNKIKNFLITMILILSVNFINPIEKPKIITGINSNGSYGLIEDDNEIYNYSIYPSTISDNIFFSIEEKITCFFKYKHKISFYTYDYNKYSSNLENLKSVVFKTTLDLFIIPQKNNEIKLTANPMIYYKSGEIYLKLRNKIQYELDLKNFLFKTYYSNLYSFKEDEIFYHNIAFNFCWSPNKYNFIKFKSGINIFLQHYINDFYDKLKETSLLKSVKFNFEIAIDFNKVDFDEVFNKNYEDENFFNDEEIEY